MQKREGVKVDLEKEVLIHRYCYYVLAEPLLPDAEYDKIERAAREALPESSPVHGVGSSLPSSYSDDIKQEAERRLGR
jgi:NAD-dependent DNA ligase